MISFTYFANAIADFGHERNYFNVFVLLNKCVHAKMEGIVLGFGLKWRDLRIITLGVSECMRVCIDGNKHWHNGPAFIVIYMYATMLNSLRPKQNGQHFADVSILGFWCEDDSVFLSRGSS